MKLCGYLFHNSYPELVHVELALLSEQDPSMFRMILSIGNCNDSHFLVLPKYAPTSGLIDASFEVYDRNKHCAGPCDQSAEIRLDTSISFKEPERVNCNLDIESLLRFAVDRKTIVVSDVKKTYCAIFSTLQYDPEVLLGYVDCVLLKDALYKFEKYRDLIERDDKVSNMEGMIGRLECISRDLGPYPGKTLTGSDRNYLRDVCLYFEKLIELDSNI